MKRLTFCMLNPSKAGAWPDGDLTVAKVCGFSARIVGEDLVPVGGGASFSYDKRYRYRLWRDLAVRIDAERASQPPIVARVDLVNLSAFISTDPDGLRAALDPFGPDNMHAIDDALAGADVVVAAWGSLAALPAWMRAQSDAVLRALTRHRDVMCLGKTADGSPRHPSRIAYSTAPELFRARRDPFTQHAVQPAAPR